jgi:glycerophosphoryl diester phosphodiesterase
MSRFHIFAHRGFPGFPENTLLSFDEALRRGVGLELDVHRTRDGVLVVFHDSSTKRLTGVDAKITELTLEQVKHLSVGGEKIPTLMEALEFFKKMAFGWVQAAIQVKDCTEKDIEQLVADTLQMFDRANPKFGVYERVFVFDVTMQAAAKLKQLNPKIRIALSIGEKARFPDRRYPTVYTIDQVRDFQHWDIVWADEWAGSLYSEEFVKECQEKLGKPVYAISPELHAGTDPKHPLAEEGYEDVWKSLILWGASGICTDHVEDLKELAEIELNAF